LRSQLLGLFEASRKLGCATRLTLYLLYALISELLRIIESLGDVRGNNPGMPEHIYRKLEEYADDLLLDKRQIWILH